jgi:hypothetical protein
MRPTPKAGAARHGEGDEGVSNLNRGLVYHVRLGALHNFVIEFPYSGTYFLLST